MIDVVIVFIVCMFIGKVYCGVFNFMYLFILFGYVIWYVVLCVGIELDCIEDVVIGLVFNVGIVGGNIV